MAELTRRPQDRPWSRVAAVGWTLLILALCTIPGRELPDVNLFSGDKIGHFGIFAGFGWLWMRAYPPTKRSRRFKQVLVAGLAYAVLTEVYQGLMPFGREADVWDAVANSVGLLAGTGIQWIQAASSISRNRAD